MQTFQREIQIRFRQADPAGILFFGNITDLIHDSFEDFLAAIGIPWAQYFANSEVALPIHHLEVKYLAPFFPGKKYSVEVVMGEIRSRSFSIHYRFWDHERGLLAEAKLVHICLHVKDQLKVSLPDSIRSPLLQYQESTKANSRKIIHE